MANRSLHVISILLLFAGCIPTSTNNQQEEIAASEPNPAEKRTAVVEAPSASASAAAPPEEEKAPYLPEKEWLEPTTHKTIGTFDDWVKAYQGLNSPEADKRPPQLGAIKDLGIKSGQIAYTRSGDIFVMDLSTRTEKQLTRSSQRNINPKFLADGKRIAFMSNRDGMVWRVFIMNADGSDQRPVTRKFSGWVGLPSYEITPDGAYVAYNAAIRGTDVYPPEQMHLVNVITGEDQAVGRPDYIHYPTFVGVRPTLYYVSATGFDEQLMSVDVQTKEVKALPSAGNHFYGAVRGLGDRLLFPAGPTGAYCCRETHLFTTTLEGIEIKALGNFWVPGSIAVEVSPKGSKVAAAWSARQGGFGADYRNEVSIVDHNGEGQFTLTPMFPRPFYSAWEPTWAPDDRHLALTLSLCPYIGCSPTIRSVVVIDTKKPKATPIFIAYGGEASWSPTL